MRGATLCSSIFQCHGPVPPSFPWRHILCIFSMLNWVHHQMIIQINARHLFIINKKKNKLINIKCCFCQQLPLGGAVNNVEQTKFAMNILEGRPQSSFTISQTCLCQPFFPNTYRGGMYRVSQNTGDPWSVSWYPWWKCLSVRNSSMKMSLILTKRHLVPLSGWPVFWDTL